MPASPKPDRESILPRGHIPRCPVCRKATVAEGMWFPFCSPRCKQVDLGRWLDGDYRIEVPAEMTDREPEPDPSTDDEGTPS